jgi:hypothetical protein
VECPLLFLVAASEVVRVAAEERSVRFTVAPVIEGLLVLHPTIDAAGFESLADKCPSRAETEKFYFGIRLLQKLQRKFKPFAMTYGRQARGAKSQNLFILNTEFCA